MRTLPIKNCFKISLNVQHQGSLITLLSYHSRQVEQPTELEEKHSSQLSKRRSIYIFFFATGFIINRSHRIRLTKIRKLPYFSYTISQWANQSCGFYYKDAGHALFSRPCILPSPHDDLEQILELRTLFYPTNKPLLD